MARKIMRIALLTLIGLAAAYAAAPGIGKIFGLSIDDPMSTFVEKGSEPGACVDDGVTLVIDYGLDSGRATKVICAKNYGVNPDDTGWGLFEAAEQTVSGTTDYPTGFVCRINGYPSPKSEPCASTPNPKVGSWVYFTASGDSEWRFSNAGAGSHHPRCGDYEGWRFVQGTPNARTVPREPANPFTCE